jgi:SAM-dependent MidA family methyltransferase
VPENRHISLNMTGIRQIIKKEIADNGPISFARFMELALYCPDFGYYDQPMKSPGRKGDFYTSVSVGGLFGQLLACQSAAWLEELPPGQRQIVEAGAHNGQLASDILTWLRANRPAVLDSTEYWILEPSRNRRRSQEEKLGEFRDRVHWFESWVTVPAQVRGVVFGNELLDAMPVRRWGWDAARRIWLEWGVGTKGDKLTWTKLDNGHLSPRETPVFGELPESLLDVLPNGFMTEDSPTGAQWWREAARALDHGKLMTLDYGLTREEFFTPERSNGTLRAYYRHHQTEDVLSRPGEQDITSHVNFSAIQNVGEAAGLRTNAFITQSKFLTGILEQAGQNSFFMGWSANQTRQFQTLTHPEHLGRNFRVLVQSQSQLPSSRVCGL